MTPPPTDLVDQLRHEIDEEAPPPAIVLPPVSGPLSNAAASVVNTIEEEAGDNETDEEASDDDSDKDPTFIRSLGAWSKPLHFTPPPTPPEPATPRFGVTEMLQSQIDSFWPSIGEATVNGPKQKGHLMLPKKSMTQMPVDKIPPPALKEDGSLRFPWAARMNQSSRNLFRATEPTYRLDGTPQVTIPSKKKENASPVDSKLTELNESRAELLNRILNLKQDLQSWRGKLDTQVQVYREELSGLKKTLNLEVEQLREEFKYLKTTLNQQQDDVSASLKSLGLRDDSKDSKEQMVTEERVEARLTDENAKEAEH